MKNIYSIAYTIILLMRSLTVFAGGELPGRQKNLSKSDSHVPNSRTTSAPIPIVRNPTVNKQLNDYEPLTNRRSNNSPTSNISHTDLTSKNEKLNSMSSQDLEKLQTQYSVVHFRNSPKGNN